MTKVAIGLPIPLIVALTCVRGRAMRSTITDQTVRLLIPIWIALAPTRARFLFHLQTQIRCDRRRIERVIATCSTVRRMPVATGTAVNGTITVEGASLSEGAVVTVLSRGAAERFLLSESQENELLVAIAEIEQGEFETPDELLASLPKQR